MQGRKKLRPWLKEAPLKNIALHFLTSTVTCVKTAV